MRKHERHVLTEVSGIVENLDRHSNSKQAWLLYNAYIIAKVSLFVCHISFVVHAES